MENEIESLKSSSQKEIAETKSLKDLEALKLAYFGAKGKVALLTKRLGTLSLAEKADFGKKVNELKNYINQTLNTKYQTLNTSTAKQEWLDVTAPGIKPEIGHLHLVTQAIEEITRIFERIGFTRVRYPEIDWEWYAFESLNMPKNHPARDDFETFFIDAPTSLQYGKMVLSPHTSSGQVREMERLNHKPPIRMINIAKCYRPNWDVSHIPMFHQFEGLVVDEGINITHLKGVMDYFAKNFFGPKRETRLRPFHFQFTEPSFEVDINCGVCLGKGKLPDGSTCRLCKEGWMELGGSGMVHPNVLKAGKIDSNKYTGFAFGWGVERTFMMKSGTKLDDIRLLYSNDIRFLEQF
ncbi:phenylalanine--tRNA ligase subunit alpha [Candidatus Gottesmanbacteria bacterium]|nr:phenylalanine--tRNA ligase subunit alpha [Candidatus Gottesmanbacteria bacterium]